MEFLLFFSQALVPLTIEVEVPFELHRYIIGQKGSGIRKMMDEFEVGIYLYMLLFFPFQKHSDRQSIYV